MNFIFKFVFTVLLISRSSLSVDSSVTVDYSPASLRFGLADSLHLSDFDNLIATVLGYTPKEYSTWSGLTITSAFQYPKAVVVFGVKDGGLPIKLEGTTYELNEDDSLMNSYDSVTSLIGARAQRAVHFQNINASTLSGILPEPTSVMETKYLDKDDSATAYFLEQISVLPTLADYLSGGSSVPDGGQDVIFVTLDSFAPLVHKYGAHSTQISDEATPLLRASLVQTIDRLRRLYQDRVVVFTALLGASPHSHVRRARDAPFGEPVVPKKSYNLAAEYSDDFPVIFNIVLILTIILLVAVIASSVAIAFMDPGRDSIIYRMTNPRMKKDQ